jgi:HSP90 family molecular chaperone
MSSDTPLWLWKHSDCQDSDYISLYQSLENTTEIPLKFAHFIVEGSIAFNSIIYISKPTVKPTMKLYFERNLMFEDYQGLIPEYLDFVGGVVETEDDNLAALEPILRMKLEKLIRRLITNKVLKNLEEMVDEISFPLEYFRNLKLHFASNAMNRPKIYSLLRFETFKTRKSLISFDQYISEMTKNQTEVCFILLNDLKCQDFKLKEEVDVEVFIFENEDLENIKHYETLLNYKLKSIQ